MKCMPELDAGTSRDFFSGHPAKVGIEPSNMGIYIYICIDQQKIIAFPVDPNRISEVSKPLVIIPKN